MNIEYIMRFQCTLKFAERDNFIVETSKGSYMYDSYYELPSEAKSFITNSDSKVTVTATGCITKYFPKVYVCDGCYKTDKEGDFIKIQVGRESGEEKTICVLCRDCFKSLLKDMKKFNKELKEGKNEKV